MPQIDQLMATSVLPRGEQSQGDFTLPLGGSNARHERSGRADGGSIGVLTALPGNSLALVSDPPKGRVKFAMQWMPD